MTYLSTNKSTNRGDEDLKQKSPGCETEAILQVTGGSQVTSVFKTKNPDDEKSCRDLVLEAGLEPARPEEHRILSPACLPIPPLEH